jgi:PBP1b-binding outer membrane lipoprotein LpoB
MKKLNLVIVLALMLSACSTISHYDQAAYEHAVNAKVDTLDLVSRATGSYDAHAKEIESLLTELDKAYEYDRGRPLNLITVTQWNILRDPDRDLLGGFLKMWKAKGALNPTFVAEKKAQISDAFDQIIQLESGKLKPSQVK